MQTRGNDDMEIQTRRLRDVKSGGWCHPCLTLWTTKCRGRGKDLNPILAMTSATLGSIPCRCATLVLSDNCKHRTATTHASQGHIVLMRIRGKRESALSPRQDR